MKIMFAFTIVAGLLLATGIGATVMAQDTTGVLNGSNSATVTQSGDPADTRKSVERGPGHTRIEQRNGGNSSVITQDSGGGTTTPDDNDDDDAMPALKPHADGTSRPGINVYGALCERAAPQSRANLDTFMNQLDLGKRP